jgi:hypothetical protein
MVTADTITLTDPLAAGSVAKPGKVSSSGRGQPRQRESHDDPADW